MTYRGIEPFRYVIAARGNVSECLSKPPKNAMSRGGGPLQRTSSSSSYVPKDLEACEARTEASAMAAWLTILLISGSHRVFDESRSLISPDTSSKARNSFLWIMSWQPHVAGPASSRQWRRCSRRPGRMALSDSGEREWNVSLAWQTFAKWKHLEWSHSWNASWLTQKLRRQGHVKTTSRR